MAFYVNNFTVENTGAECVFQPNWRFGNFDSNLVQHSQQTPSIRRSFQIKKTLLDLEGKQLQRRSLAHTIWRGRGGPVSPVSALCTGMPKKGINCHRAASCSPWPVVKYFSFSFCLWNRVFNTPWCELDCPHHTSWQCYFPGSSKTWLWVQTSAATTEIIYTHFLALAQMIK